MIRMRPSSPDLAGVENGVRIEERLHAAHEPERGPVLALGVTPVSEPHPVLARARPAERERRLDQRIARRLRDGSLGIVGEDERMPAADARVAAEMYREAALGGERPASVDMRRQRAYR